MWQHTVSIESASVISPPTAAAAAASSRRMPCSISPAADQREAVEREREHLDVDRPASRASAIASADPATARSGRWSASAKCARSSDTHAVATLGGSPSTSSAARSTQPEASAGPRNA